MATPNIVPRADQEGGLGTAAKAWGKLFIENPTAGGTAAATINNLDTDQAGLTMTLSNVNAHGINVVANSMVNGNVLNLAHTGTGLTTSLAQLYVATSNTTNLTNDGVIKINYNKSGNIAGGNTHAAYGIKNSMTDTGTNSGTTSFYGYQTTLTGVTSGQGSNYGHIMICTGGDENYGHVIFESIYNLCPVLISKNTPWSALEHNYFGYDLDLDNKILFIEKINYFLKMNQESYDDYISKMSKSLNNFHNNNKISVLDKYIDMFG